MKKLHKLFLMAASLLCAVMMAGCGDEEGEGGSGGGQTSYQKSLVGTWVMKDIQPYDNEYVDRITFDKGGKVDGYFREGDGDLSHFQGTYSLKDRDLTIRAVWVDEADEERETWNVSIMTMSKDEMTVRMNYGDDYTAVMTFARAGSGDDNDDDDDDIVVNPEPDPAQMHIGGWKMTDMSPSDNEHIDRIWFDGNGALRGIFLEGSGELSYFQGTYSLDGKDLTIRAEWTDEEDQETETWHVGIMSATRTRMTVRMDHGDGDSVVMEFERISDGEDAAGYAGAILGDWVMDAITPWDNEYVQSIRFDKNGEIEGYFREGDGDMSHFGGAYSIEGRSLTIYARWTEDGDNESELWACTILSLSRDKAIIRLGQGTDYAVVMDFVRP